MLTLSKGLKYLCCILIQYHFCRNNKFKPAKKNFKTSKINIWPKKGIHFILLLRLSLAKVKTSRNMPKSRFPRVYCYKMY